ncbi:MAG: hypothetical protein HYU66_27825 [Armatimonadetes bacterium]|nr:hypothetical protein [Armatimonadota bacterium]
MNTEIRWQIEGETALGGAVPFHDFRAFMGKLADALRATEIDLVGADGPRAVYTVSALSCSSPAVVGVRAAAGSSTAGQAIPELKHRLHVLHGGQRPSTASDSAIRAYARLAQVYDGPIEALRLLDDEPLLLPRDWRRKVRQLLAGTYHCVSTYRGVLEGLNMRTGSVGLEPLAGPDRIPCAVPPELRRQARDLLGEMVDVRGVAYTRAGEDWPYRFAVHSITQLPPAGELPTAEQIIGSIPGLTNGRGALAYLQELRDAET